MGKFCETVELKTFASGPLTKEFAEPPVMFPLAASVSRLAGDVAKRPLFKAQTPLTVTAPVKVTPVELLIVRLLTAAGRPVVTCAAVPSKM